MKAFSLAWGLQKVIHYQVNSGECFIEIQPINFFLCRADDDVCSKST
jgi:hypothetical protein